MPGKKLPDYVHGPGGIQITPKLETVDINVLDQLLKDNRRVEALRRIVNDLQAHGIRLRVGDKPGDEELVALSRIVGILADDWVG